MQTPVMQQFRDLLGRRLAGHLAVRCAAAALLWAGWAAVALPVLLAADLLLALEPRALFWLGRGVVAAAAAALLTLLAHAGKKSRRRFAADLDRDARDARQPMLSAHDLSSAAEAGANAYLPELAVSRAAAALRALPGSATLPLALLKRRAAFGCAALAGVGLALFSVRPVAVVPLSRLLHPDRDIPPYSRFSFTLHPDRPVVLYGDDVNLAVQVEGPRIPLGVDLLTRVDGAVRRTPCYAEGSGRHAQRVERVTRPVEFCFAVGRARSRWRRVEVNLEPRIVLARFTVQPPAYSRLPARTFVAGDAPLRALPGSRVRLDVTSNRPLKGGRIVLTPTAEGQEPVTMAAVSAGRHVARFDWTLDRGATLDVVVSDLQGAANREPYRLKQAVEPDARPTAFLTDPPPYAVATPASLLRLAGYAEDDLGIRQVTLIRGLNGYHDRARSLALERIAPRQELEQELHLGRLGVTPGQVLEFFLETTDTNPDETGRAASEVARVEIVSEEEYARMLRERTSVEQFLERYRAATWAMEAVREAMEKLEEALGKPGNESEIAARREALKNALADAAALFEKLAADFPIYELEKESAPVFSETAKALVAAMEQLQAAGGDSGKTAGALAEMQKSLGERQRAVREQAGQAEFLAQVARVLELESVYLALVAEQTALARQYARYTDAATLRDPAFFRAIEDRQSQIREALTLFEAALRERAGALAETPELKALKLSALKFADAIAALKIPDVMREAEVAAARRDGPVSKERVEKALELMRSLLGKDCPEGGQDGFGEACKGPVFSPKEPQNKTLKQLKQCKWPGLGQAGGMGWGAGEGSGEGEDGMSGGGMTPLNIPMIGPPRTALGAPQGGAGLAGSGGAGRAPSIADGTVPGGDADSPDHAAADGTVRLDEAPEKYREALKKYFTGEEEGGR
jgi:hypothetical protein